MSLGKTERVPQGKSESPKHMLTVYDFCHPHSLGFVRLWSNRGEKRKEGEGTQ